MGKTVLNQLRRFGDGKNMVGKAKMFTD